MLEDDSEFAYPVYRIECEDGHRYVVYNAFAIGNPADHVADKWYFRPYPARFPLGAEVGEPFETAEDAQHAVRGLHARSDCVSEIAQVTVPDTPRATDGP